MNDSDKIKAIIDYSRMSKRALGIALGYSNGTYLGFILSGRNGINVKIAKRIADLFPEISYAWLLKGEGEMIIKKEKESNDLGDRIAFLEKHIKGLDARIELLELKIKSFPKPDAPTLSGNKLHH